METAEARLAAHPGIIFCRLLPQHLQPAEPGIILLNIPFTFTGSLGLLGLTELHLSIAV
jgi:hypothetical protein